MPIKIDFLANVRDFLRGTDSAEDALDDVADSLDDLATEAKTSGRVSDAAVDDLADSFEKLGRQAERSTKDAERSVDDLGDSFRDAARNAKRLEDAGKDAGKAVDDSMERAERGVDDFKEEAAQSARETAASFDGSFESIADLGQEVAANAFSGFGPAGVAAGIGVAAAVGVIVDNFNKIGEAADEARESAFQMAYDVSGALDQAGYSERLREWTSDLEKVKQVRDLAVASGWDEVDVLDALASGGPKLDQLTTAFDKNGQSTMLTIGRLGELQGALDGTAEGFKLGSAAAELNDRALYDYAQQAGKATGETDDLGNAILRLPDGTEVVIDADTKRANANVDAFESNVQSVKGKTVTVTANGRSDMSSATRGLNTWIAQNDGRTFKIRGRYVSPLGGPTP